MNGVLPLFELVHFIEDVHNAHWLPELVTNPFPSFRLAVYDYVYAES